jgi:hypothetical protein
VGVGSAVMTTATVAEAKAPASSVTLKVIV